MASDVEIAIGTFAESANMRSLFAASGVRNPATGEPYTEAMLFGLGGGVGFMLFVFEYAGYPPILSIVLRYHTKSGGYTGFTDGMLKRAGVEVTRRQTAGSKAAREHLLEVLNQGKTALCWIDQPGLPFLGMPSQFAGMSPSTAVVTAYDPEREVVTIADPVAGPVEISMTELGASRARMRALKNTVITVAPPATPTDHKDAVRDAIRAMCDSWFRPEMTNFGLPALERWELQLRDQRDKRGWPALFGEGKSLFTALARVYDGIEVDGGGGAFRPLYAAFLDEAGTTLDMAELLEVAADYRELGHRWTALAQAALPDEGTFGEARALLNRRLILRAGAGSDPAALRQLQSDWKRFDQMAAETADDPPWNRAATIEHFSMLADIVHDIAERERRAAERLARFVD